MTIVNLPEVGRSSAGFVLGGVGQAARSFLPSSMPRFARRSYAIELVTTFFFALALSTVEGGFIGVFTKQTFEGVADPSWLNFVVALVAAAPELANIVSFVWVSLSHGRAKIPFINGLQLAVIALAAGIAVMPRTGLGLAGLAVAVVAARVCWSGISALRPTVWRANYSARVRARIVGKFSTVQQVLVAMVGLGLGLALDWNQASAQVLVPLLAGLGIVAVVATSRQRVRGGPLMLKQEGKEPSIGRPWNAPAMVWRVLRKDPRYAQFMLCMFVLGFGNLMVNPVLVIILKDQFGMGYFGSVLVISGIPYLLMPLAIPLWARLLDRAHVVKFRSIHGWMFVLSTGIFLWAVLAHSMGLMYAGAVVQGIAYGGGTLAWNLGHVDFARPSQTSQYMATHLTLNGVRGLVAPLLAVGVYDNLARVLGMRTDQSAAWVLASSEVLCVVGCAGFVWLRVAMKAGPVARNR